MIAQVVECRGMYIVQVMITDINDNYRWENVDVFKSEGKSKLLKDHLQNNDYKSVSAFYRSEFYREFVNKN